MGNNPVSVIDPDGGFACIDADGNSIPCPEGYEFYSDENDLINFDNDAFFDSNMNFLGVGLSTGEIDITGYNSSNNNFPSYVGLSLTAMENFGSKKYDRVTHLGLICFD